MCGRILSMEQSIRAWRVILRQYAPLKPYAQLQHLQGYLKSCGELGELLPDPYIPLWRETLRRLIPRALEHHQVALVTLYETLAEYQQS